MDRVIEKISKLNATNQSMNNSVLSQSTAAPAPLRPAPAPARAQALSTIVPASPSVAPQSLNFDLSSPVRQVGLTPMQASSIAMNTVQQFALSSMRAATTSQEAITMCLKVFQMTSKQKLKKQLKFLKIVTLHK
jgi:hypothetical protein